MMWRFLDAARRLLSGRWRHWVERRHPRGTRPQVLTQHRIYIFASRSGLVFGAITLAMLTGAINYDLALVYLLVFLLLAMAIVSIFHTFRNLLGTVLIAGRTEGCFAGGQARFEILLDNPGRLTRHSLRLSCSDAVAYCDVPASGQAHVWLALAAPRRGWMVLPRLRVDTRWPLGIFQSWSYGHFSVRALVYPRPEVSPPPLPVSAAGQGEGALVARGHDDFAGLRPFTRGDSPQRIAWKAAAADRGLPVKEFHGEAAVTLVLTWDSLPSVLDVEARLSRLTAWVLAADVAGYVFQLTLPGATLGPASGATHRAACLAALATWGLRDEVPT